jgi:hypothetical protein
MSKLRSTDLIIGIVAGICAGFLIVGGLTGGAVYFFPGFLRAQDQPPIVGSPAPVGRP